MGIQNLLPFLSKYAREVSLDDLRGKVCGIESIDVFGWLYKGAYIFVCIWTGYWRDHNKA